MKRVEFLADALVELRKFPEAARKEAGVQLHKVQMGLDPSDWKPMATVGAGVREIRMRDEAGAFRCSMWRMSVTPSMCCMRFRRRRSKRPSGISTWPCRA